MFQLKQNSPVQVVDNKLVSDGFGLDELQKITVEKMEEYSGENIGDLLSADKLFMECCYKAGLPRPDPAEHEAEYVQPAPEVHLPGTDTLADREIELPKTDLVIEVDGKVEYDEKAVRRAKAKKSKSK